MAGTLFTASQLDGDGRNIILDDTVVDVHYYNASAESWDKTGAAAQSWASEVFIPHDSFDGSSVQSDKWDTVLQLSSGESTVTQAGGTLLLGVELDEGTVAISSENKWKLSGDFDIRLYIDWSSYYNEYRSITNTFLKVGVDSSNAARISFKFDGEGAYSIVSEKTIGRSLTFFDWKESGTPLSLGSFAAGTAYSYFKVTRQSGVIRTYVSDGETDTQIGDDLSEAALSGPLFVEMGVQAKEYNRYRTAFTKFFIAEGTLETTTEFFSSTRGRKTEFPDTSVITVDSLSLSIIDEAEGKLWLRVPFEAGSPLFDSNVKVHACGGSVYCATSNGLVVYDFPQDKVYRYLGSSISVADEPIALRNAGLVFRTAVPGIGNLPADDFYDVSCREVAGSSYIAVTTVSGVSVMRALASGVANCVDGTLPAGEVEISATGGLYWSGYNPTTNEGNLSYFSNITALGDTPFNRTGFYDADSSLGIFGAQITAFDVLSTGGADRIAVGTTEGLSFLDTTRSFSYGVTAPADNPVVDPSFENYLGIDWIPFQTSYHERGDIRREASFSGAGQSSLGLKLRDPDLFMKWQIGDTLGVFQDNVDMSGVERLYFDSWMPAVGGIYAGSPAWVFEMLVGDTVVKSYEDTDGPFTRLNDSADVSALEGVYTVTLRLRISAENGIADVSQREIRIDNLRTKIGEPEFRVLPLGNASVKEVLLQYDANGHKIYFATPGGYGALDLDDHSLDYFTALEVFGPAGAQVDSADFARITEDV